MKTLKLFLATLVAFVLVGLAPAQSVEPVGSDGFFRLDVDPFIPGGMNENNTKEVLYKFHQISSAKADECITFSFNYDIPVLRLKFWNKAEKKEYTTSASLRAGEPVVATIDDRVQRNGVWIIHATVRWVSRCGNPWDKPIVVRLTIPVWDQTKIVVQKVEVPKPFAVTVEKDVIIQQIVPELHDINITVPEAERSHYRLSVIGTLQAQKDWVYQKDFFDNVLDFLKVAAFPIAELIHRPDNLNNSSSSSSSSGSSSSSSSSSSASASAAAAAGG